MSAGRSSLKLVCAAPPSGFIGWMGATQAAALDQQGVRRAAVSIGPSVLDVALCVRKQMYSPC